MTQQHVKVLVTGAAGQIGYALIFRIASGEMFGKDTTVELRLLELEAALPALHGVVMELQDCAFPLLKKIVATSAIQEAMDGVNWCLFVGAVPRKAGMERSDLLKINGGIFSKQGEAINQYAASDVRVLVIGNPCNTNCLITMHHAPDVPKDRFFAMTMLDEKRARAQLAMKANVDVSAVTHMAIWGNHSTTQYPDFYHAYINGRSAAEVIGDEAWLQTEFLTTVQNRGAEVIKARGSSSAASAAHAIISSVNQLIFDTVPGECFSVALASRGEYGIDKDLIFSFPCRVQQGKLTVVERIEHHSFAQAKINFSLEELRAERKAVEELNLI